MLTQLTTVKSRLAIDPFDLQYDAILTNAINAVSVRFDKETNRTLARTTTATQEFSADDTEICLACYPVESVTKFELTRVINDSRSNFIRVHLCISVVAPFRVFCVFSGYQILLSAFLHEFVPISACVPVRSSLLPSLQC